MKLKPTDLRTVVIALVAGAIGAATPAIADGVRHALFAHNADKVDGIHASKSPAVGKLVPLNAKKRIPAGPATWNSLDGAACTLAGKKGVFDVTNVLVSHTDPQTLIGFDRQPGPSLGCVTKDLAEPNDSRATRVATPATQILVSIFPAGDVDWFFWDNFDTGSTPFRFTSGEGQTMDFYIDGTLVGNDVRCYEALSGQHDYEIEVSGPVGLYSVRNGSGQFACPP